MKINFEEAKQFLSKINKKDRIAIFVHDDLDGVASAVLFYDFCISRKVTSVKVYLLDYGKNKISDFDIYSVNKILIADLAPIIIYEDLKKISKKIEVFYTDHHLEEKKFKIPKRVLELRTTELGYIPSSRTVYELCGGKKWLAVLGVLADFGEKYEVNKEFIESYLKESGKSLEYLKQDLMYTVSRALICFKKNTEKNVFDIIKEINSLEEINEKLFEFEKPVKEEFDTILKDFEINHLKKDKKIFYYFEPVYDIKSILINFISSKYPDEVVVFLVPLDKGMINISIRNQSKKYDVCSLLKEIIKPLKNASAGGHLAAAGGFILKKDLEKFKERFFSINLNKFVLMKYK